MRAYASIGYTKLPAAYGRTIYAAHIEGDRRAAFYVEGDTAWTVDIGSNEESEWGERIKLVIGSQKSGVRPPIAAR